MNLDDFWTGSTAGFRFRPVDGSFRARLIETLIDREDEEFAELFSESGSDIVAAISGSSSADGIICFQVYGDFGERSHECVLSALTPAELADLQEQLSGLDVAQTVTGSNHEAGAVVRRRATEKMLSVEEAARELNLTGQQLKSNIPCTDYTYTEIDGKIDIEEYFWSTELVARLSRMKKGGANAEDIKYVAEECCHGDDTWAREIVSLLTKPAGQQRDNTAAGTKKEPARTASPKKSNQRYRGKRPA